jgi:hypothetical protein
MIRTNLLVDLLKTFPDDAIVRGFEGGLTLMNADGTGQVVILHDHFPTNRNQKAKTAAGIPT